MNPSESAPKKRVLVFPFGLLSHYLRCIVLAKQYSDHEVLFAYCEPYAAYLKKAGYGYFKVEAFDPETVMACAAKFDFSWLNKKDIERVLLSQVEAIKDLQPTLVIGDTAPGLKMAAELCGVKYLALMNGYMTKHYAETRALSKTHPGYKHLAKLPKPVADKIIKIAEAISFRIVQRPFRQIRRQYGLKRIADYVSEMEGDENLVCDPPYLFPQRELPANYRIIEALIYNSGQVETALLQKLDPGKITVCVCMGSSGNWQALSFLSHERYDFLNIVTAGDKEQCIRGEHVLSQAFVNLEQLLPACSLLICHGGNGTVHLGIRHKVFMLCLTSHFEQEWNVQRLEALKLGLCIDDAPQERIDDYLAQAK